MPGLSGRREDPGRTPTRARPVDCALVVLFDALWFGEAADPEPTSSSRRAKVIVSEPAAPPVHHLEDDVAPQGVVSALEVGVHRAGMCLPTALGPRPHRPRGHSAAAAASWHPAMPPQLGAPVAIQSAPPGAVSHTLAGAGGGGGPSALPLRLDPSTWLPTAAAGEGAGGGWLTPGAGGAAAAHGAPSPASDPGVMLPGGALSRMTSCPAVLPWPLQQPAAHLAVPDGRPGGPPGAPHHWPQRWSPTIGTLLLSGESLMQRSASAPAAPRPLADAAEEEGSGAGSSSGTRWAAAGDTGRHPGVSRSSSHQCCTWRSTQAAGGAAEAAAAAAAPVDDDGGGWRDALDRRSSCASGDLEKRHSGGLSALSEVVLGALGDSTSTSTNGATPTTSSSPMTCDTGRSSTDMCCGDRGVAGVAEPRCEVCGMSPVAEGEEGGEARAGSAATCTCSSQPHLLHGSLQQSRGSGLQASPSAAAGREGGGGQEAEPGALLFGASAWPAAASPPPGCSWGRAVYHSATSMEAAAEAAVAALGGSEAVATLLAGLAGSGVLSGAEEGATAEADEEEEPGQHLLCGSDTGSSLPSSAAQLHQEQQLAAAMAVMAAAAAAAQAEAMGDAGGIGEAACPDGSSSSSDAAAWRYWFAARWRQARRAHLQGRGAADVDSPDPLQFLKVHGEGVAAQLAAAAAAGQARQQQGREQGGNTQRQQKQTVGAVGGVSSSRAGAASTHGSASRLLSSALALDSGNSSWPVVSGSGGLMGCSGGEAVAELAREAAAAAALLQAARTGARPMPAGGGGGAGQQPGRKRSHMAPAGPAAGGAAATRPAVVGPLDRRWVGMLLPAAAVTLGGDSRQAFIMARLLDGCAGAAKVLLRGAPRVPPAQLLADLQLEVTAAAAAARLPNTALVQFCGAGVLRLGAGRSVHVVMSSAPTPAPLAGGGTSSAVADVAASVARGLVGDSGSLAGAAAALLRTHLPHDYTITY